MTRSNTDYTFEMFGLRKQLLGTIADAVRDDDFVRAKHNGARLIRTRAKGDQNDRDEAADAFETSFDRAKETVERGGDYELEIDRFDDESILYDHDAEIDPRTEIDGEVVEVITSRKTQRFNNDESSTYPVVQHPSGFRVCTCAAQKYYIVCPHTLARVIERNWRDAPLPA